MTKNINCSQSYFCPTKVDSMTTKTLSAPEQSEERYKAIRERFKDFDINSRLLDLDEEALEMLNTPSPSKLSRNAIGTIGMVIVAKNMELILDVLDVNLLGCSYPHTSFFDGVDFSAYDGYKLGVSRRHALLRYYNERLLIIDNDSTNGTYLNLFRLEPKQAYLLHHNDHLHLGALECVLKFK